MSDVTGRSTLDELAAVFDLRAKAARDQIKPATPNMRVALLREQARTWEEAARIVRNSVLKPARPTPPRPRRARARLMKGEPTE